MGDFVFIRDLILITISVSTEPGFCTCRKADSSCQSRREIADCLYDLARTVLNIQYHLTSLTG